MIQQKWRPKSFPSIIMMIIINTKEKVEEDVWQSQRRNKKDIQIQIQIISSTADKT
jgi:hypothetical protein